MKRHLGKASEEFALIINLVSLRALRGFKSL